MMRYKTNRTFQPYSCKVTKDTYARLDIYRVIWLNSDYMINQGAIIC